MIMKKEKLIWTILGVVFIITILGIGGTVDRIEQTIYHMDETTYKTIKTKLGNDCSDYEIVKEYNKNKDFYDKQCN